MVRLAWSALTDIAVTPGGGSGSVGLLQAPALRAKTHTATHRPRSALARNHLMKAERLAHVVPHRHLCKSPISRSIEVTPLAGSQLGCRIEACPSRRNAIWPAPKEDASSASCLCCRATPRACGLSLGDRCRSRC